MTNKEAIDRLIGLRTSYKIRIEEDDLEALDKGIEALENQKIGHWIAELVPREQPDNWDRIAIKCSECGTIIKRPMYNSDTMDFDETVGDYTNILKKNHYCFNCGAKMVETQESEE